MTEVTPHPLKTQGFHYYFILLFYDHPTNDRLFFLSYFTSFATSAARSSWRFSMPSPFSKRV